MRRRFFKRMFTAALQAAVWAAVFAANSALHRRAYERLLAGNTEVALMGLRFVTAFEPNFYLHRGAMGKKALARAFQETASLIGDKRVWFVQTSGPIMSSPSAAGGAIFIGNNGDTLMKIDAASHKTIWEYQAGGDIETRPLIAPDGKIYAAAHDGLHAVDAETGEGRLLYPIRWAESSPAWATGAIFIGTDDGRLLALDAASGKLKWAARAAGPVESSPAVSGGRVFFGCNKGMLYAVDAETGGAVWEKKTAGRLEGRPLVMNGSVFVGTGEERVFAFDEETGGGRWERNLGGSIQGSVAGAKDTLVVGTMRGEVFALYAEDGSIKWTFKNAGPVEADPAISGNTVYVGTHYGFLHALDLETGKRLWSFLAGWDVDESAPLVYDGYVYFGAMDGRFYAIRI